MTTREKVERYLAEYQRLRSACYPNKPEVVPGASHSASYNQEPAFLKLVITKSDLDRAIKNLDDEHKRVVFEYVQDKPLRGMETGYSHTWNSQTLNEAITKIAEFLGPVW